MGRERGELGIEKIQNRLVTARQCKKLFSNFSRVSVRKGDFEIGHVAVVHKFLPSFIKIL